MRLFLAVEPDRAAEAGIARVLLDVQQALGDGAAELRWVPASNIHVTLHFLGEIDRAHVEPIADALGGVVPRAPFDVALGRLGVFPPHGRPKVVWAGVDLGRDGLSELHETMGVRLSGAGVPLDARPFSPHLTLARARDAKGPWGVRLREALASMSAAAVRWRVDHVTLFQSDLSGPVPKYLPLQHIRLAQGDGHG